MAHAFTLIHTHTQRDGYRRTRQRDREREHVSNGWYRVGLIDDAIWIIKTLAHTHTNIHSLTQHLAHSLYSIQTPCCMDVT